MSSYSSSLGLYLMDPGTLAWAPPNNTNLLIDEQAISGYAVQSISGGTTNLNIAPGSLDPGAAVNNVARNMYLRLDGGGAGAVVTVPTGNVKLYFVFNNTANPVNFKTLSGTGVSILAGKRMALQCDGTNVVEAITYFGTFAAGAINGTPIGNLVPSTGAFTTLSANDAVTLNPASANVTISPTGTGTVAINPAGTLTLSPTGALTINPTAASTINNTSIGATVRSTGAFTTLAANSVTTLAGPAAFTSSVSMTPANLNLVFTPTGTGTITINPNTVGTIRGMAIGQAVVYAATFGNGVTNITVPNVLGLSIGNTITGTNLPAGTAIAAGWDGSTTVPITQTTTGASSGNYTFATAAAGAFTTLGATGATSLTGSLTVNPANLNIALSPTGTGTVTINPATAGTINAMSIGATTRSTGAFTTLTANNAVTLSPANQNVTISPTGTGTVSVNPAVNGDFNNMDIGQTTPGNGTFTSLKTTVAADNLAITWVPYINTGASTTIKKMTVANFATAIGASGASARFLNSNSASGANVRNCSIARTSLGLYTVTLSPARAANDYAVVFGAQQIGGNPSIVAMIAQGTTPSTSSFQIEVVNESSRVELNGIISFALFD